MLLELTEALACPVCAGDQGLVAFVDELVGRRVQAGWLGCPTCEGRWPVEDRVVRLVTEAAETGEEARGSGASEAGAPGEALLVAAALDLADATGYVVLDEAAASLAPRIEALAPGCELMAFVAHGLRFDSAAPRTSYVRADPLHPLPLLADRLCGAALTNPSPERIRRIATALAPRGRLLVRHDPESRAHHPAPLELLVSEPGRLVAVRP